MMTEEFQNAAECWKTIIEDVDGNRGLLPLIEKYARENTDPAKIVFGTSGWRGEIGTDFTFNNIRIVTSAIIQMFRESDHKVMKAMGVADFSEIKNRGIIVGHDNRFLGPQFADAVMGLLIKNGIRTWYAGEAITPEFSAGIEMMNAACSINLTPSHNPANYGGFKFNPSDGGPAGPEITKRLEDITNELMSEFLVVEPVAAKQVERIDLTTLYIEYILERKTLDLRKIKDFVAEQDCTICIDNVHGATRGKVQRIIGKSDKIKYLRTEDDYLFGGVAPEPSGKNMCGVEEVLSKSSSAFKLGVILDPDGDRIRFTDGSMQISMNHFGAMALHFLNVHKGFSGIAAKSVGTSNLVNAIAKKLNIPLKETMVGFKNFRPYMLSSSAERAIVCFEESDGISGYNHTLEKDAIFGILLAVEMMAVTGKNISDYLKDIMDEYGYYYPDRSGIEVDRSLAGDILKEKLATIKEHYSKGTKIEIDGHERTVKEQITVDGIKLVFDDGSWLMIRPSGTEPKVRFYIEARTLSGKKAVFETAERMTRDALGTV
ncbi:MAG TPA: phosphomannomutase [Nitrospirae bacterium]|nr:phosphomannomutase [Nitrospirota bacterium]